MDENIMDLEMPVMRSPDLAQKKMCHTIDKIYTIQEEIQHLKEELQILESEKKLLEKQVVMQMRDSDCNMMGGVKGRATIATKEVASILPDRWDDFHEYIIENNAFHLLQKRITQQAMLELMHGGVDVPGAKIIALKKLKITKI